MHMQALFHAFCFTPFCFNAPIPIYTTSQFMLSHYQFTSFGWLRSIMLPRIYET